MEKVRTVSLTAAILLMSAGCADSTSQKRKEEASRKVQVVMETFERATGDKLVIESHARDMPIIEDATLLGVPPELDDKYGDFGIVVYEELGPRKRALLTPETRPDRESVYWEYHPPTEEGERPYWSAAKFYGDVILTWFHPTKQKTAQWERLDDALRHLPST